MKRDDQYQFDSFASYSAGTGSAALPAADTAAHQVAFVSCEDADVRFRVDGGDATAGGHVLHSGDTYTIYGYNNIRNFRYTGVGGTLKVSYGKDYGM